MPEFPLFIVQWHGQFNAPTPWQASTDALAGLADPAIAMGAQFVVIAITGPDRGKQFHVDRLAGTVKELDQPAGQLDPQRVGLIDL